MSRLFVALLLWPLAGSVLATAPEPPPSAAAAPTPASGEVRLPEKERGSAFWTFAAHLESGERLFLELFVTNLGLGDRNAGALGYLVRADGTVHDFRKARREGTWELSADGRRLRVGPVLFDQSGSTHRLHIDRSRLKLDVAFPAEGPVPAEAPLAADDQGLTLVRAGAPLEGTLWQAGDAAPRTVRGTLALTTRWAEALESSLVARRIQFFSLQGEASLYLLQATGGGSEPRHWVALERDGRIVGEERVEVVPEWPGAPGPFALPAALELRGERVSGRIALGSALVRDEPLRHLPLPVRLSLLPLLEWRVAWSDSAFEVRWERPDEPPLRLAGTGVSKVTQFEPQPPAAELTSIDEG